jgi:hypothetical protein
MPGEVVQGCVYINAPQPYPVARIILNILGFEKSWWRDRDRPRDLTGSMSSTQSLSSVRGFQPNNPQIPISGDRFGECKIIEAHFVLSNFTNGKNSLQGQYAFPFLFQLPKYVPGSYREERSDFKASIVY